MWIACVRDEIQVVTFTGVEPCSRLSTRAKKLKGPEHRGEGCAGEREDRSRIHSFRERHDRVYGKEDRRFRIYQCHRCSPLQIMARPPGPLEAIIDKELERSCAERSVRELADKAIANSSTEERKVRQQVEQRRKERKQLKV